MPEKAKRIRMNNTRTQQVKEWFGWDDTVVNKVKEMKQARGLLSAYRIMLLEKGINGGGCKTGPLGNKEFNPDSKMVNGESKLTSPSPPKRSGKMTTEEERPEVLQQVGEFADDLGIDTLSLLYCVRNVILALLPNVSTGLEQEAITYTANQFTPLIRATFLIQAKEAIK